MRGRFFLTGFIALLLAAIGLLGPGTPVHAAPSGLAAAPAMAMSGMPADCPMNDHARKLSDGPAGMPDGCVCCCAVVASLAQAPAPSPPSVSRLAMAPTPLLTGGPGRSIPPALGPPRSERDIGAA